MGSPTLCACDKDTIFGVCPTGCGMAILRKSVASAIFSVRKVYFCRLKKTCHHVEKKGLCFTLPLYIGFLLDFDDDDKIELQDLDIEAVNRFANEYSM